MATMLLLISNQERKQTATHPFPPQINDIKSLKDFEMKLCVIPEIFDCC